MSVLTTMRNLFGKRPAAPVPTGRTIDMTRLGWGHNISLMRVDKEAGMMNFAIWVSKRPQVGDEIIWKADRGIVRGLITEVSPTGNVWDMSFINVKNVRLDNDDV